MQSSSRPSPSGPCRWMHSPWTAWKSPSTCASAIVSPPAWTVVSVPGGTSSTRATVTNSPPSTAGEASKRGIGARSRRCYPPRVATILLAGVDLFFRGKLEALLPGHHFVTAESIDDPDLVIADIARIVPEEVADTYPAIPIV